MFAKTRAGRLIALYGILFSFLFLFVALYRPAFFSSLDNKLYDIMLRSVADYGTPLPLIVDIDEKSLAEFGQWPWPRYHIAHLLEKLAAEGAASVGLDILFAESDRTSLKKVQREMHAGLGIELNLEGIPEQFYDNDAFLADILARGPYVIGYKFLASGDGKLPPGPLPVDIVIRHDGGQSEVGVDLPAGTGIVAPLPVFAEVVRQSGFVNVRPDDDGIIRRIPLLMRFEDRVYPSLALASVMQAVDAKRVFLKVSTFGAESLRLNETVIPVDAFGNLLIRYQGKGKSFEYISAADLLNDRIDGERIAGRVVFVGTSAAGLKDTSATPLDPLYPGVEVHASVADNILHGVFLDRPAWAKGAELLATLCVGILVSMVLAWSGPVICLLFLVFGSAVLWFGGLGILKLENIFLSPIYPLMMLGATFAFLSLLRFRLAEKQAMQRTKEIEAIEGELRIARDIQMGILPKIFPPFPDRHEFEIYALLEPAKEVGGDLYDFFFIDQDHLCFAVGDVSGKGVPAALFMAVSKTLIKMKVNKGLTSDQMLTRVNQDLLLDNPSLMFVTVLLGILDIRTGEFEYCSAGHDPPYIIRTSGDIESLELTNGVPLGLMEDFTYQSKKIVLQKGETIFIYTDGVTEAMNSDDQLFSDGRLEQALARLKQKDIADIVHSISSEIETFSEGTAQSDDITMLALKFYG